MELRLGYLVLKAPGMLRMDIPLDVIEDDDSVRYSMKVGCLLYTSPSPRD